MFKEKHQFYVQFLGWVECRGLKGRQFTDPVIHDLRRKYHKLKNAPKLTIQISKKELKISKDEETRKKKIKTIKFPPIPTRDVTYVTQSYSPRDGHPEDIVACIYLGLVPRTNRYVHVHVYRFDSPHIASKFVRFLDHIIAANFDRIRDIEQRLASSGDIDPPRNKLNPRLNSSDGMSEPHTRGSAAESATSTYSGDTFPSNSGSDDIEPDMQSLRDVLPFDSVTDELNHKLRVTVEDGPPMLLPPKDYDTVCRRHGNLDHIEKRKCLQLNIVGGSSLSAPPRNESGENGIDVSSTAKSENKVSCLHSPYDSSPSSSVRGFAHSPQSSPSPKLSGRGRETDRYAPFRNPSFSSAYSGYSCKSDMSTKSNAFSDRPCTDDTVIYRGAKHIKHTVIPPANYDPNETIVVRKHNQRWKGKTNSQSVPAEDFEKELKNSIEKRMVYLRHSNGSQYADVYAPRGKEFRVRRVNSMYI